MSYYRRYAYTAEGEEIELMPAYEEVEKQTKVNLKFIDMNKVESDTIRWFPKMKSLVMFRFDMNKMFENYKIDEDRSEIRILSKTGQHRTFFWKEYNLEIGTRYHAPAENIDLWIIWVTVDPEKIPMKYKLEKGVDYE